MGYLVERGALIDSCSRASISRSGAHPGVARGGHAIVTCAFGIATGIVGAVVDADGPLAFPAMLKAGYNTRSRPA